jgi:DNA-binding HxlR family transcriptional regulator
MRSYGQYCSVAKALDVVGDRWTLLIIRELIQQGPCRYTDLRNGLPGIATNLLADRLRELEEAGLVQREEAAPPIAATLFTLTPAGAELEPALRALGEWGLRYMTGPRGDDEFRSQWFSFPVSLFLQDTEPDGPPVAIELRVDGRPAVVQAAGGEISTRLGSAAAPDLVLTGDPQLILGLLGGFLARADAVAAGLEIEGDASVLGRLQRRPPAASLPATPRAAGR